MKEKEIKKLVQIAEISRAIEKHLESFQGETEQLEGALTMAVNMATKKNAIVKIELLLT